MLKSTVISRDVSGNTTLTHNVSGGTYSGEPSGTSAGFWIKAQGNQTYDAYEMTYTVSGGDATTTVSFRPWYYMVDHLTGGSPGWVAGTAMEDLPVSSASGGSAPVQRINSVPTAALRMYIQVTGTDGTAPTDVYITVYGIEGMVADVSSGTSSGGGGSSSASASASAGGGDALYISPEDFVVTYTSATTLTLTGLPYTPDIEQFVSVSVFDSTGKETVYTPSSNAFSYNSSTGVLTVSGATFSATDGGYRVLVWGPDKAYSQSIDAKQELLVNPPWDHYSTGVLLEKTSYADTTGDYYYLDMSGFTNGSFQLILDGGSGTITATLEGTIQDDGTAPSACSYADITNATFGTASFSATTPASTFMAIDNTSKLGGYKYLRWKIVVNTGGANDASADIYYKLWY